MKTYIFGSNGFVGKNLAEKIGDEVVFCDNGFLDASKQVGTIDVDITSDKDLIDSMFKKDFGEFVVINLAAMQKILGTNKKIRVDSTRLRKSDRPAQVGSNKLLKDFTGSESKFSFEQAVADFINWRKSERVI